MMMKHARHFLFFMVFAAALGTLAFIPKQDDPIDKLVSSLQRWANENPQEKVYLHMDKPYCALGDTIWFKAYVTIGSRHQLSKMSGALYVELIDENDSLLSSVKLPLTAGMAMGDFTLGDEYKEGNFRIRAYTQWMRNAGEEYFSDHTFSVGDPLMAEGAAQDDKDKNKAGAKVKNQDKRADASSDSLSKSDIQFFPEGGSMVNNINSRIGFKATGTNGRGAAIKGTIIDNADNEVCGFESLHAGMGVFNITPQAGKKYKAKLIFTDGSSKTVALPGAANQGYVLSIYQPNADSILVRISASSAQYQTPQSLSLIAQSGGEAIFAAQVKISKAMTSVWMLKKDFPTGIAQFTLFDNQNRPMNERIAFIKTKDKMELNISSAKKSYKGREKVTIDLESKDRSGNAVAGNFSVSVIDESKVSFDENNEGTIMSNLLLSSDIKGYIEQPNYYFTKETEETNKALDNLMLTQGYRRFTWKEILSTTSANADNPLYKAESLGTEISGRVLTLQGKPVVNGEVTLMSLAQRFIEKTKTDAEGRFKYEPIMLADSLKFVIQARTSKNGKKVEIVLDSVAKQEMTKNINRPDFNTNITESIKDYLTYSKKQDEVLSGKGRLSRINRLKEIKIIAKKKNNQSYKEQGAIIIPEGHADQALMIDGEKCANLGTCLQGLLHGVTFQPMMVGQEVIPLYPYSRDPRSDLTIPLPMQVILDGRKVDAHEGADILQNNALDPADILKVEVVISNMSLVVLLGKPTILIYTKKTKKPRYTPGIANIKPRGFNITREFYAPRYDQPNINDQIPDLRSTIYWNPKVKTFASGHTSFSFFNADGPGTYSVVVEGINAAGELGRELYRYRVE